MSRLFWLNEEQWAKIEPLLPHYGSPPRVDELSCFPVPRGTRRMLVPLSLDPRAGSANAGSPRLPLPPDGPLPRAGNPSPARGEGTRNRGRRARVGFPSQGHGKGAGVMTTIDMDRLKADASGNTGLSAVLATAVDGFSSTEDAVRFLESRGFAVTPADLAAAAEEEDAPGEDGGYVTLMRFVRRS